MARKMQQKYICENCNFVTCNKYNYDKHLLTAKHKNTTKTTNTTFSCKTEENIILKKEENLTGEKVEYSCDCGKTYPYRASLYNHKKKCPVVSNITVPKDKNIVLKKSKNDKSKDLIVKLVEENTEIRNLLCKQFETMQNQMWEQQKIMNEQINELLPKIGSNNTINKNLDLFFRSAYRVTPNLDGDLLDLSLKNLFTSDQSPSKLHDINIEELATRAQSKEVLDE